MNNITFLTKIYNFLLRLYPTRFRTEFEEPMLQDFSDLVNEAHRKSKFALYLVCIREIVDFPINLLKVHYREGILFKKLQSKLANHAVRGALGFGAGFAFLSLAGWWLSGLIYQFGQTIIANLSASATEAIRSDLLSMFPFALYLVLIGLTFGIILACFLGNRANFWRYVFAGALCWLIPEILSYVLVYSLRLEYYRNEPFTSILGYSMLILIGGFFSVLHATTESEWKRILAYLSVAVLIYPVTTYLFIKLLFNIWHEVTPAFFISLIAFVVALVVGVMALARPDRPRQYLVILAGSVGYLLLNRAVFSIAYYTPGFSILSEMGIVPDVLIVPVYHMAVYKGILGALFGLIMGLIFGYQRKNNQPLVAVED